MKFTWMECGSLNLTSLIESFLRLVVCVNSFIVSNKNNICEYVSFPFMDGTARQTCDSRNSI